MILTVALISAGVTVLFETAKYIVKKTKNKTDDKVIAFLEANKDAVIGFLANKAGAEKPSVTREKVIDHRKDGK